MPCIRRTYNYAVVYLSPEVCFGGRPLCGQTVEVLGAGEPVNEWFAGFADLSSLKDSEAVMITGLTGYSDTDEVTGPWIELKRHDVYLGATRKNGVVLVVEQGRPIKVKYPQQDKPKPSRPVNNVVTLKRRPKGHFPNE